jgi:hypothetical protein
MPSLSPTRICVGTVVGWGDIEGRVKHTLNPLFLDPRLGRSTATSGVVSEIESARKVVNLGGAADSDSPNRQRVKKPKILITTSTS